MNYEEVFRNAIRSEIKRREGTVTRFVRVVLKSENYVSKYDVIEGEIEKFDEDLKLFKKSKKTPKEASFLRMIDARLIRQFDVYWEGLLRYATPRGTGTMAFYEIDWNDVDENGLINRIISRLIRKKNWSEFDLDEECDGETEKRLRESIRQTLENATRSNDEVCAFWKESTAPSYHFESKSFSEVVEKLKELPRRCQERGVTINATIKSERLVRRYVDLRYREKVGLETKTLKIDPSVPPQDFENLSIKGEWFILTTEGINR